MRYMPPSLADSRWYAEAEPAVGAPFTAFVQTETSRACTIEVLPVPSEVVGCSRCVVYVEVSAARCTEMPNCKDITFLSNTPEAVRLVVMHRLGLKP